MDSQKKDPLYKSLDTHLKGLVPVSKKSGI